MATHTFPLACSLTVTFHTALIVHLTLLDHLHIQITLYHSFVPSVIGLWNNLPHSLKAMPSISTLKGLYCIIFTMQVHVRH